MPTDALSPVNVVAGEAEHALTNGLAICLSGGGYRAMLFHAGSLWRMLELGFLGSNGVDVVTDDGRALKVPGIAKISSVSGGSIVSAVLALAWPRINPDNSVGCIDRYRTSVIDPIRQLAGIAIAGKSLMGAALVIRDVLLPGSVSDHVESEFAHVLYGKKTLQDLPDHPTFVFNASNLQSGALWRFQKASMRDYEVGQVIKPTTSLAKVVAASAAFPPMLAPCILELAPGAVVPNDPLHPDPLFRPPYTTRVLLADGGVYDNLGLETAFKGFSALLVSNAGSPFEFEPTVGSNWITVGMRCLDLMDRQVGALRTRLLIENFQQGLRLGAYWAINSVPDHFTCPDAIPCDPARTAELAAIPTDMDKKSASVQERLINWGYAVTDRAIRAFLHTTAVGPQDMPYPKSGI